MLSEIEITYEKEKAFPDTPRKPEATTPLRIRLVKTETEGNKKSFLTTTNPPSPLPESLEYYLFW